MLKIKTFALLLCVNLSVSAQDYCAVLFEEIELKSGFMALSKEELIDLCTTHSGDFNQPVFTYGSEDPSDWLTMVECVQRYSDDMQPEGLWLDINGDEYLDLVISFLAGYEYTYVAFYLQHARGFTCIHTGTGEFYGRKRDESLIYVHPACCNDPSHEFYTLEAVENAWQVTDSFSVTNAYSGGFPSSDEVLGASESYASAVELKALGVSGIEVTRFPVGSAFRLIKEIDGDGHKLFFAEVGWAGDKQFFPKTYCWVELE